MSEPKVTERHIAEYRFDPKNARKHTPRNVGMIGESLQKTGAGRSILVANDGTIIAGNATVEAAGAAGFERVIEVEADGRTLVAVKRVDLDPESEQAVLAGLYDNRAAEPAYWDVERIQEIVDDGVDLSGLWYDNELEELLKADDIDADFAPDESANKGFTNMTFSFTPAQHAIVSRILDSYVATGLADVPENPHKPSNALYAILERDYHE